MINLAILTGGDSDEAESSFRSAENVYALLGGGQFNRYLVAVEGWRWRLVRGDGVGEAEVAEARFHAEDFSLELPGSPVRVQFHLAFPIIHGPPAETGQLQGYLDMLGMPYVGSGVLASALAMDKAACKRYLAAVPGLRFACGRLFSSPSRALSGGVEENPGFPCIVKPNACGSAIGVALVRDPAGLKKALAPLEGYDRGVLVEAAVVGRELTVGAVVLDGDVIPLPAAEVFRPAGGRLPAPGEFVAFTNRQCAELRLQPQLGEDASRQLAEVTVAIGHALGCRSFYRVDYILGEDGALYFLEVNTIPGMTPTSVFTRQVQASPFAEAGFYQQLVHEALAGHPRRRG